MERNKFSRYEKGRNTKIISRIIFFFSLNCIFVVLGTLVFIKIEGSNVQRKAERAYQDYKRDWEPRNISETQV